ncbi:MAG: HAD hydrolase-like protein [bacterium]|nr:HAD hydrolase-like protein [bacterium]MDZ4231802.1 HAD hydrolase-like protein [Candidatus Pacearchaeota archaeon]
MKTSKPYLFLDFDGTLLDVFDRCWAVHSAAVRSFGKQPILKEHYKRLRRKGFYEKKIYEERYSAVPPEVLSAYEVWKSNIEKPRYLSLDKLHEGAKLALRKLASRYTLILVSARRDRGAALAQVERLGIISFFEAFRFPGGTRDPWKNKYRVMKGYAGEVAGIIGDTEVDILAGKECGVRTFAVANGLRTSIYLKGLHPTRVCRDIRTAANALML